MNTTLLMPAPTRGGNPQELAYIGTPIMPYAPESPITLAAVGLPEEPQNISTVYQNAPYPNLDSVGMPERMAEFRLSFDGNYFQVFKDGNLVSNLPAWSGKKGYQHPNFQYVRNTGPIPEGTYRLGEFQENYGDPKISYVENGKEPVDMTEAFSPIYNSIAKGWRKLFPKENTFYGNKNSWGDKRIYLHPMDGTNTEGRSEFFIHGGNRKQSAGCINLDQNMNKVYDMIKPYADLQEYYPQNIFLDVNYEPAE